MSLFTFDVSDSGSVSFEFFLDHVWNHPRQKGGCRLAMVSDGTRFGNVVPGQDVVNLLSEGQSLNRPGMDVLQPTRRRRLSQRLHKFKVQAQLRLTRLAQQSGPAETCLRYYSNMLLLINGCKRATIACDASRVAGKRRLVSLLGSATGSTQPTLHKQKI
eukprot:2232155-Amphidinium_carterae.2